eukprot:scaffold2045_cov404-Prasinococcus_capsulatus_cf.AAC.59
MIQIQAGVSHNGAAFVGHWFGLLEDVKLGQDLPQRWSHWTLMQGNPGPGLAKLDWQAQLLVDLGTILLVHHEADRVVWAQVLGEEVAEEARAVVVQDRANLHLTALPPELATHIHEAHPC